METGETMALPTEPDAPHPAPSAPSVSAPSDISLPPPLTESQLSFPRSLLPRSGMGPDMVVGSEPWHRALPADWVPIIARDAQIQQQQVNSGTGAGASSPFSDAYLSTQPAKRRKIAAEEKPEGDLEKVISETLQEAIASTGIQPASGVVAAALAASGSERVREAVKGEVVGAVKRRLDKDQEYKTHESRFPNSKSFASKKK
jgi:hypothetical protein